MGQGVEDVAGVGAVEAVEVEVERVAAGAEVAASYAVTSVPSRYS